MFGETMIDCCSNLKSVSLGYVVRKTFYCNLLSAHCFIAPFSVTTLAIQKQQQEGVSKLKGSDLVLEALFSIFHHRQVYY